MAQKRVRYRHFTCHVETAERRGERTSHTRERNISHEARFSRFRPFPQHEKREGNAMCPSIRNPCLCTSRQAFRVRIKGTQHNLHTKIEDITTRPSSSVKDSSPCVRARACGGKGGGNAVLAHGREFACRSGEPPHCIPWVPIRRRVKRSFRMHWQTYGFAHV